jgi:hypothetical protein
VTPSRKSTPAPRPDKDQGKLTPAQYWRRRTAGFALLAIGAVVFIQHLASHMGFFTVIAGGADDLLIGYPTAGLLAGTGALILMRT